MTGRPAAHRRRLGRLFTRLWLGFGLASAGDGFIYGAVPLLAVVVDPRPLAVSAVAAADTLPWLVMALPAGHLADRYSRNRVVGVSNVLRAAAMFTAAALVVTGHISLGLLIALVLINAAGRAVYFSSVQAIMPGLLDPRDFEQANGIIAGTEAGAESLAGPVIGTWLFSLARSLPFLADGIALIASCIPFVGFHPETKRDEVEKRPSGSMLEGARLLFANPTLRVLVLIVASLAGLQGMESGVLVLLATTRWGVSAAAYGLFLASGAVGALVGSLVADGIVRRIGGARALISAGIVSGAGYLVMASAGSWVLAAPAFALVGLAVGAGSVAAVSLRQRLTPDHLMGRVGSAWRGIVWGAAPLGAIAAGSLASVGSLVLPLILAGVLQCAVTLLLARPLLRSARGTETRSRRRSEPPPLELETARHAPAHDSGVTR
jgi:MFS family permease